MSGGERFAATFIKPIDKKGRVSVPPKFRTLLGAEAGTVIHARPHLAEPAIEAGGADWLSKMMSLIEALDPTSEVYEDMHYAYVGSTEPLTFDSEGRIVLSDVLRAHAGLEEEVAFVGLNDHFTIWAPAKLNARMARARERAIAARGTLLKAKGA